ncbi:2-hydroxy-3-oxopropionate reductase [Pseudomonas fluorescens]|uniref:NAD(P)-dependent oxidoreductase n=1 Tax=Pseudomonas fluorescens TaxID=294 RepID=UPI00124032D4|nr:NAD(P)-dependent oxidoreductase [Pseudomonas fluorescens]VVP70129.1 2-hydroxy-3-oxopropionate reductase [Pseudomonas fluorescens]
MTGVINIDLYKDALKGQRIGLIGLGKMGRGIAVSLIRNRVSLTSFSHKSRKGIDELIELGGVEVSTPREIAESCSTIILSLPSTKEVDSVCFGSNGLITARHDGLFIVDTTTGCPVQTRKFAEKLLRCGIRYVDAPLTRGPKEARRGELNAILGSPEALVGEACTVLSGFCRWVLHVGETGEGQKVKLLNNALSMGVVALSANMIGAAQELNINPHHLRLLIQRGAVNNEITQSFFSAILDEGDDPLKFSIGDALKDLNYCSDLLSGAENYKMIRAAREVFLSKAKEGRAEKTLSHLLKES